MSGIKLRSSCCYSDLRDRIDILVIYAGALQ